jgi:YHS domain-containing protein
VDPRLQGREDSVVLVRFLLLALLVVLVGRAVWRLIEGIVAGASLPGASGPPQKNERMVRDPICGTFVLPSRALSLATGGHVEYFCSEKCRAAFHHQPKS